MANNDDKRKRQIMFLHLRNISSGGIAARSMNGKGGGGMMKENTITVLGMVSKERATVLAVEDVAAGGGDVETPGNFGPNSHD